MPAKLPQFDWNTITSLFTNESKSETTSYQSYETTIRMIILSIGLAIAIWLFFILRTKLTQSAHLKTVSNAAHKLTAQTITRTTKEKASYNAGYSTSHDESISPKAFTLQLQHLTNQIDLKAKLLAQTESQLKV